jgi:hypothetical protein
MGGFTDFVDTLATARNATALHERFSDGETVSMWQSLAFGPNYKAAYCLAVCPAGEDVIGAYRDSKKAFLRNIVDPLQDKVEDIYVLPGSDAEDYVRRRFPHKATRRVGAVLRPTSVDGFLANMSHVFQRNKAAGLNAIYHFVFTGAERREATVAIAHRGVTVEDGLVGTPNLRVTADGATWVRFLRKEASLPMALLTGRIRLRGDPRLLVAFGRCFPV